MLPAFVLGTYLMIHHLHPCWAREREWIILLLNYFDLLTFSHIYAFSFLLPPLRWIPSSSWASDFQLFHSKKSQHFIPGFVTCKGCWHPVLRQNAVPELGIPILAMCEGALGFVSLQNSHRHNEHTLNFSGRLLSIKCWTGWLRQSRS